MIAPAVGVAVNTTSWPTSGPAGEGVTVSPSGATASCAVEAVTTPSASGSNGNGRDALEPERMRNRCLGGERAKRRSGPIPEIDGDLGDHRAVLGVSEITAGTPTVALSGNSIVTSERGRTATLTVAVAVPDVAVTSAAKVVVSVVVATP